MIVLTARAAFWLLASAAAARVIGGQRLARLWLHAEGPLRINGAHAAAIAMATHRAARVMRPRPSCLSRALAAGRMLASEQLEARLTIGVSTAAGAAPSLAAHAWLTHGDLVLTGAATDRAYTPLCAIDAAAHPLFVPVS